MVTTLRQVLIFVGAFEQEGSGVKGGAAGTLQYVRHVGKAVFDWENPSEHILTFKTISYSVGLVSRKRPFSKSSTEAQIGLS